MNKKITECDAVYFKSSRKMGSWEVSTDWDQLPKCSVLLGLWGKGVLFSSGSVDRIPERWASCGVVNWAETASVPQCNKRTEGIRKAKVKNPEVANQ